MLVNSSTSRLLVNTNYYLFNQLHIGNTWENLENNHFKI